MTRHSAKPFAIRLADIQSSIESFIRFARLIVCRWRRSPRRYFMMGPSAIPDLAIALWICSNPTPDDLSIGNLELGPEGEVWFSGIIKDVNLVRDTLLFARYVKDYFSLPEIMSEVAKSPITELGAPWMLSTICMVCNRLNLSLRDAWTMGIGQLIWYRAGITELETDSRIVSPELRDEMAKAKTGSKKFAMEPGETLDQFSERIGFSAQEAAILLHGRPVHG